MSQTTAIAGSSSELPSTKLALVPVQATSATAFVDSIGVNTHIDSGYANWEDASLVESEVAYLGVKNLRDGTPYAWALPIYVALAQTGVRFDLTQENPVAAALTTIGSLQDTERADTLEQAVPGSVESLEGADEYNINSYNLGTLNSYGNLAWGALDDQNLQAAVAADPILSAAGVLVVAASTSGVNAVPAVGSFVSASNWHVYGGVGQQLADGIAAGVAAAKASAPGDPVYITETGISSSGYGTSTWGVADPVTQGIIDTNAVLDGYNDGATKTFLYDLMDDANDSSVQEDDFGLFNINGTPKPAATDLRNLISLLSDGGTGPQQPGSLSYSISGLPATASSMLLEKSDGSFYLVIWNGNATLYNGVSDVTPPVSAITVTLGSPAAQIATYDPIIGLTAQQSLADTDTVTIALSADPIIIQIEPGGAIGAIGSAAVAATLAPVAIGSGPDTLALAISEDAYEGNAEFTISIDGHQIGGIYTTEAMHADQQSQIFDVSGSFATGQNTVAVDFLNDAYSGTPTTDRNLYVNQASINGISIAGSTLALYGQGTQSFSFGVPTVARALPAVTTIGSGPDTLSLTIDEDAWQGNAQFTVSVDGQQIGGVQTATALRDLGQSQTFDVEGSFAAGTHTAVVDFLNDLYGGSPSEDRNLYVTGGAIDGSDIADSTLTLMTTGTRSMVFAGPGTTPTPPPTIMLGSGPDVLALSVDEDAYSGNAQFTVSVDGQQIGGVQTATALHDIGATQAVEVEGDFAPGTHTVTVDFLNDLYDGTPETDRNLYVTSSSINNVAIPGGALTLDPAGPQSFHFLVPAATSTPAPGASAGVLTLNLSETSFNGDAQVSVAIDGQTLGGTHTVTALTALGASQALSFSDLFAPGTYDIAVSLANGTGTAAGEAGRSLLIDGASYNGMVLSNSEWMGSVNGTSHFSLVVP